MQPFTRHEHLLAPMSRATRLGAVLAAIVWAGVWVGVFFVVGDAFARASGAAGVLRGALEIGLPALLSVGWIALLIRAARNHARRRRLLRQEFIDQPQPPASRPDGA
jgi:hypothetical protein